MFGAVGKFGAVKIWGFKSKTSLPLQTPEQMTVHGTTKYLSLVTIHATLGYESVSTFVFLFFIKLPGQALSFFPRSTDILGRAQGMRTSSGKDIRTQYYSLTFTKEMPHVILLFLVAYCKYEWWIIRLV